MDHLMKAIESGGFKYKTTLKRKIHYPFKWIQLNGNVKIGYCILKNLTILTSSI